VCRLLHMCVVPIGYSVTFLLRIMSAVSSWKLRDSVYIIYIWYRECGVCWEGPTPPIMIPQTVIISTQWEKNIKAFTFASSWRMWSLLCELDFILLSIKCRVAEIVCKFIDYYLLLCTAAFFLLNETHKKPYENIWAPVMWGISFPSCDLSRSCQDLKKMKDKHEYTKGYRISTWFLSQTCLTTCHRHILWS